MNVLADAWKSTCNVEKHGKRQAPTHPCLKVTIQSLTIMMKHGHISETEIIDDHSTGNISVNPTGRLKRCGGISPRSNAALRDMEKWTMNLLPTCQSGYIVLTTSGGIMDHEEARR